jgi:phosphatidate cytidylyltransferase
LVRELFRNHGSAVLNAIATLAGVMYVSTFLGSLVGLRELFTVPHPAASARFLDVESLHVYALGGRTVVTVFVSLWVCDTFAYFAGRFFGRHKLFERVSPNKTWEGAIAGYVGGVAIFLISQNFLLPYMTVGSAFVCGSIIGIFGQVGDLVESLLKRDAGVKDSSALIPGHGGVLDRFDSLMFVAPLLFLYLRFVVL